MEQPQAPYNPPQRKSRWQSLKEVVRPPDPQQRIEDDFGILKQVGGLRYLQNIKDLEQRRTEIMSILDSLEGHTNDKKLQRQVVDRAYRLFFTSGSMWYRGLDNRELTSKVSLFLQLYNDIGHLQAFNHDLFMCAIMLLHLSFQALDVTNTPAYVLQTTPFVMQGGGRGAPRYETPEGGGGASAGGRQE